MDGCSFYVFSIDSNSTLWVMIESRTTCSVIRELRVIACVIMLSNSMISRGAAPLAEGLALADVERDGDVDGDAEGE